MIVALVEWCIVCPMILMLILAQPPTAAPAGACTTATAVCTEWIGVGGGPGRSLIYRTHALDTRTDRIRTALVMVHGTTGNPDHYFQTATAAAFLAGALEDAIVIAPRVASADGSCRDALAENEISWSCGGDSWRSGGAPASHKDLSSFDFMDAILKELANRRLFPNLSAILVAGHSAGRQFLPRYEKADPLAANLGRPAASAAFNP